MPGMLTLQNRPSPDWSMSPDGSWSSDEGGAVTLHCPGCHEGFALQVPWTIGNDGMVLPSAVCPQGCGFHALVRLEGWKAPSTEK